MNLNSEENSSGQYLGTEQYIQYLQEENKRLTELVATLIKQASEKEAKEAAERKAIQAAGIKRAQKAGVKFGRPSKPLPVNFYSNYKLWKSGEISRSEAARRCNMAESSFRYQAEKLDE